MFDKLGSLIYRGRWMVLAVGLIFMVLSGLFGISVFGQLKAGGYDNPSAESTNVENLLKSQLGADDRILVVLFTSKDGSTVESPGYKAAVENTLSKLNGQPNVGKISTFYSTGATAFASKDHKSTYAAVGLEGDDDVQLQNMARLRPLLTSDTLQVQLGGYPPISEEINAMVQHDLAQAETLSFPIVFVLLVVIFGSLLAAALPLFIGGFAILGAFLVLQITTNFADVSVYAINIVTMLGLGLAIDYSLFIVSRFREELVRRDGDVQAALIRTMQTAGRTVIFSGLTVMISLLSLVVFPQMFLKSLGWGGASAVMIAMIGAVTVLPAILALMGHRVNSLSVRSIFRRGAKKSAAGPAATGDSGFWYNVSNFVMQHPILILIVGVVPLLIVGLPFFSINISVPDHRVLPLGSEGRQVGDALMTNFSSNETQPIQLVVHSTSPALDKAPLDALFDYTRQIETVPGVTKVESLVTLDPQLDAAGKAGYEAFYSSIGSATSPMARPAAQAAAHYSNGEYNLVNVLYDGPALGAQAQALVKTLRGLSPPQGLSAQVGGQSAQLVDFLSSLETGIPLALGLIVIVMFVLLFLMLGSLIVPLKAVVLNVLSLSASFGAIVWIFQDGNLSNILGFTPTGNIDGTMPVLIFAIAFGLSMDYEVFLLSRIKETYDRTGDTVKAVATGVQRTGGIITSAAVLLVVVIGTFSLGQVLLIKLVGTGLALAIFVDATIVRLLLVPATMRLLGRYNWWAPRPLLALYKQMGLGELEGEEPRESATALPEAAAANRDKVEAGAEQSV
ncbi:MAG: MMPL family transporter [Chloroflexota bacterium]